MIFHVHIDIMDAIRWPDKELQLIFRGENGEIQSAHEIREGLRQHLTTGITKLTSEKCTNKKPDGSCAGCPNPKQTLEDYETEAVLA